MHSSFVVAGEPIGRSDATLMDAPLWIHAWKLLPWCDNKVLIWKGIVHLIGL